MRNIVCLLIMSAKWKKKSRRVVLLFFRQRLTEIGWIKINVITHIHTSIHPVFLYINCSMCIEKDDYYQPKMKIEMKKKTSTLSTITSDTRQYVATAPYPYSWLCSILHLFVHSAVSSVWRVYTPTSLRDLPMNLGFPCRARPALLAVWLEHTREFVGVGVFTMHTHWAKAFLYLIIGFSAKWAFLVLFLFCIVRSEQIT
jgi:hypothetical protein